MLNFKLPSDQKAMFIIFQQKSYLIYCYLLLQLNSLLIFIYIYKLGMELCNNTYSKYV